MSKLIIVPASETERHAADRIRGALETSPRLDLECVDASELDSGALRGTLAARDSLLIVAGSDWADVLPQTSAMQVFEAARQAGSTVRLILLDEAPEPEAVELPPGLQPLADALWHPVRHTHWATDVADLIDELATPFPVEAGPVRQSPARQMLYAAGLVATVAIIGGLLIMSRMWVDTPDAVGRWVAEVDYGRGMVREEQFNFRVAAGQIAGSATWQGSRRVIEGSVQDGERLSFYTRSHENRGNERRELRHDYAGIVAADSIRFELRTTGGFDERAVIEFEALRAP